MFTLVLSSTQRYSRNHKFPKPNTELTNLYDNSQKFKKTTLDFKGHGDTMGLIQIFHKPYLEVLLQTHCISFRFSPAPVPASAPDPVPDENIPFTVLYSKQN